MTGLSWSFLRRLARCLLLERNLACVRLVLRLLYVEVVGGSQLCQTARHEEVAAVALADLDEVALLAPCPFTSAVRITFS